MEDERGKGREGQVRREKEEAKRVREERRRVGRGPGRGQVLCVEQEQSHVQATSKGIFAFV
jgi:hypothetical protein